MHQIVLEQRQGARRADSAGAAWPCVGRRGALRCVSTSSTPGACFSRRRVDAGDPAFGDRAHDEHRVHETATRHTRRRSVAAPVTLARPSTRSSGSPTTSGWSMALMQAPGGRERPHEGALGELDLERVVPLGDRAARVPSRRHRGTRRVLRGRPASDDLGSPGAPGLRADAAQRDAGARIAVLDVERDGRRCESEGVGRAIAHLEVVRTASRTGAAGRSTAV